MTTSPRLLTPAPDDLGTAVIYDIARYKWSDFTDDCPDKEAVQCLATTYKDRSTRFLLARYDDQGVQYALWSSTPERPVAACISLDQVRLANLWRQALGEDRAPQRPLIQGR